MLLGFFTTTEMGGNEFLSINKNLLFYNCMTVWHDTFITYNLKFW